MCKLLVDFCSYEAAKHAVMSWHYSRAMPSGKLVKIGIWEDDKFVGCVIFGRGANNNLGCAYNLQQTEVCELVRVALADKICRKSTTSHLLSLSIKLLKKSNPGLRLIVSYADSAQGHLGIVYQATNWIYTGSILASYMLIDGKNIHTRTLSSKYGTASTEKIREIYPTAQRITAQPKHKYLYPLDKAMRKQILPLAKPYPKKET